MTEPATHVIPDCRPDFINQPTVIPAPVLSFSGLCTTILAPTPFAVQTSEPLCRALGMLTFRRKTSTSDQAFS